jgi:hypothetical protein
MIKFLTLRGADLLIRDKPGKYPIDYAHEIEDSKHKAAVLKILGPPGMFDFLQLEPPTRMTNRSATMPIIQTVYFLISYLI